MRQGGVLGLFFIFGLFLGACDDRTQPADQTANQDDPEIIGEVDLETMGFVGEDSRFQKFTFQDRAGYDAFLDTHNFRFAEPPGYKAYELTKEDLENLARWRSPKGVPWTAWAFGPDLTFESHEAFNVRTVTAAYVISDEALEKVIRFLAQYEGLEGEDEIVASFIGWGEDAEPQEKEILTLEFSYNLARWFRENVAASSVDIFTGIIEAYAWYVSPGYKKATLPPEIEGALALIQKAEGPEETWGIPVLDQMGQRAAEMVRTGELPGLNPPYYASLSDLTFLTKDQAFAALPFYRELLEVLKSLAANPENFSEKRASFENLLQNLSGLNPDYLVRWANRVLSGFIAIEENKNLPEGSLIESDLFGEMPIENYREFIPGEVEFLVENIEAFIRQWSELQMVS